MFEFTLPDLGEGVAEGEILEWHVAPGDAVTEDQVLAEVETDKAAVDVPSPVTGTVRELHYDAGDMVEVGSVIVTVDPAEEGDAADVDHLEPAEGDASGADTGGDGSAEDGDPAASSGRVFAPPNVRRLARELGVDLATVEGSGPSGRVTEADVRAAAEDDESEDEDGSAGTDAGPTSVVSTVDEDDDDGDDDDGPTSVVSSVDDGDGDDGESAVASAVRRVDSAAERDRTLATPSTRRVARELGVDVDAVPTDRTRDGEAFVTEEQVRAFAEQEAAEASTAETAAAAAGAGADDAAAGAGASAGDEAARREPYRGVRRTIGEQMARSRREVPHATHHDTAVVPNLVAARERLRPRAEERDVRLTYTPFLLKAVAAALREHPVLNSELDEEAEEIIYHQRYDIGVATATDAGLMVPVVEDVDRKGLVELAEEVGDLTERARERSIAPEEMQGGTFTVTNFGAIGGEYADPVINVPETAILGVGALAERPVAASEVPESADLDHDPAGGVVAAPTLPLSLAIDHRVIDGADGARFVNTLKEYLADPTLLLLE